MSKPFLNYNTDDAPQREEMKVVEDERLRSFSPTSQSHVKLSELVAEQLKKERMEGNVDQWARPGRHPTSPEYDPAVEDNTEGDDKPEVQLKAWDREEEPKPRRLKLADLAGFRETESLGRDDKTEVPDEVEEDDPEDDRFAGRVDDDEKQGLPKDIHENKFDRIRLSDFLVESWGDGDRDGQNDQESSPAMEKAKKLGLEYYGFGRYGRNGKILFKSDGAGELRPFHGKQPEDIPQPSQPAQQDRDVKPAGLQRVIGGDQVDGAVTALNKHPALRKLRAHKDGRAAVTQVVKNDRGKYTAGVFLGGKEHIGSDWSALGAVKNAIVSSQKDSQ